MSCQAEGKSTLRQLKMSYAGVGSTGAARTKETPMSEKMLPVDVESRKRGYRRTWQALRVSVRIAESHGIEQFSLDHLAIYHEVFLTLDPWPGCYMHDVWNQAFEARVAEMRSERVKGAEIACNLASGDLDAANEL